MSKFLKIFDSSNPAKELDVGAKVGANSGAYANPGDLELAGSSGYGVAAGAYPLHGSFSGYGDVFLRALLS